MATLCLRCQYRGGKRNIINGLTASSTVAQLQEKIFLLTDVAPHAQRILLGFPPQQLTWPAVDSPLSSTVIKSGDTLIVEEDKSQPRVITDHRKVVDSSSINTPGKLTRKVVPADNSCLFASVSYVMLGDTSFTIDLRHLIAQCVAGDPQTYNEAFLGQSNKAYCDWIKNRENWGGAIELSILARHYQTELAVIDIQSGRVDRFGEDAAYKNRAFLLYDGIHYDPLVVTDPRTPDPPLQTVFSANDDVRLLEALALAEEARKVRQYTDLSKFSLRCLVCGTPLTGQSAAQSHAQSTGHTNYGEV